ncbi:MAG: peptide chain release factor 2 [Candidatus Coatesbacteria bacterium]|nr:peptide chain release factor 2 [Candidatus Coatesbacteria bacterium]
MSEQIEKIILQLETIGKILNIENKTKRVALLDEEINKEGFWNDPQKAQNILKQKKMMENQIEEWRNSRQEIDMLSELMQLAIDEGDQKTIEKLTEETNQLKERIDILENKALLKEEDDEKDAILEIHSGAGGTDAQDWAEMLSRMYQRWSERQGYKIVVLDQLTGLEAGIKSISLSIEGEYAYGYLKGETGVHRLIRLSPFDTNHRRHTSFASVSVYPRIDKTIKVDLKEEDLRVETFRSQGAGGQSINTTDSAVRITHLPTGISISCQNERSQLRNKENAMILLQAKIYAYYHAIEEEKKRELEKLKKKIEWGSQIRSYTFHPYTMVKDHRTKTESGNIAAVMDGDISIFIDSFLHILNEE